MHNIDRTIFAQKHSITFNEKEIDNSSKIKYQQNSSVYSFW